ncbi:MAG: Fic family protein [Cytophagales bacterium]|jgi:Fic family protein|nr:Fic family protein [Cytophagales bacterium]MCA6365861.1 Fic family protein [Cytophagales bacterium]MCA6371257.1 Fic family protein [Cytophagales bacterium]MCA6374976.1 Fic family protein [Cytophagales bacterium]MCA6382715.1 Fic family protein [Cytophagales bacterium]
MDTLREQEIFWIILKNEPIGISSILEKAANKVSIPTMNRQLAKLKKSNFILSEGNGPRTKYRVNLKGLVHAKISVDDYFKIDVDSRKILDKYNPSIFESFKSVPLFTKSEITLLDKLTASHQKKIKDISATNYKREFERLMIELSWKSSQIEGNTYDLLDTEQLLKYNIAAPNHTQEEAVMLLNHKAAIEYTRENADLFNQLAINKIIDIHTLLTQKLGIAKSIRNRQVRITGTKYTPPDNQFVIEEAVENLCKSVNDVENVFEKALRALLLISYIQPFDDGNKRTARLTANALLMAANKCPLSYRSISPSEYKKAILLFYEMNNVQAFKKIFIDQYRFAVENYF